MARFEELSVGILYQEGIGNAALHVKALDKNGYVTECAGTSIPSDAAVLDHPAKGFAVGCVFTKTDAVYGQYNKWVNLGTNASCKFRGEGRVGGYGFLKAGGPVTSAGGDTTETISLEGQIMDSDIAFVGHEVSDDNDQIAAAISNEGSIVITGSADPSTAHGYVWGVMRDRCLPEFDVVFAGIHTTVGGGAAEAITVTGVLATDIAFASYNVTDDTDTISDVVCSANTVTVTCSADPGATHKLNYVVLRPKGDFQPSHYCVGAGVHTTVGGDATEVITVAGAAVGDVVLINYQTTNDTDSILSAIVSAANTLTVTLSADPSTAHKLAYAVFSAY